MYEVEEQARDLLARSAQDIRNNGWVQGNYYPEESMGTWTPHGGRPPQNCPACIYGAMIRVSNLTYTQFVHGADPVMARAVGLLAAELGQGISWWNDLPGQTAEEVVGTLERVAGSEALARVNPEEPEVS